MGPTSTKNLSAIISPATKPLPNSKPEMSQDLPARPLVVIEPSRAWRALNLREIWAARELLSFLVWRDVKVRYKQTALGILWVVLQPLIMVLIFTICFGRLAGIDRQTSGIAYPVFAFAGRLLWNFFANTLNNSSNSLVGNTSLITKIYFPRSLLPAAAVIAGLVDVAVSSVVFATMLVLYRVSISPGILLAPFIVVGVALLALGVSMILAAVNVKYRDVRHALPFVIQVWMFASPIIYPATIIPERWRWVLSLNPMTGYIEAFRTAVFAYKPIDWVMLGSATAITTAILLCASFVFRRMEKSFADII